MAWHIHHGAHLAEGFRVASDCARGTADLSLVTLLPVLGVGSQKAIAQRGLAVHAPCALLLTLELPAWQSLLTESQSQLAAWQPITDAIKSTEEPI